MTGMSSLIARTTVCGLRALADPAGHTHFISLIDPEWPAPDRLGWPRERWLLQRYHDEIEPHPGRTPPRAEDIDAILAFGRRAQAEEETPRLFIHCLSGVSRSTACALMLWAQADPAARETDLLRELHQARPDAWPNSLMVAFADEQLGRRGALTSALREFYRQRVAAAPHLKARMRKLRRGADLVET